MGFSNVPRPVFGQGLVFLCSGYDKPWLYAVRPDGAGDVTETHMAWKLDRGVYTITVHLEASSVSKTQRFKLDNLKEDFSRFRTSTV